MKTQGHGTPVFGSQKDVLVVHMVINQSLQAKGGACGTEFQEASLTDPVRDVGDVLIKVLLGCTQGR
eukprot:9264460-Prorocentrum_lima.AAC.1